MKQSNRKWLEGLIGASIGGAANAVTLVVVDPDNFNLWVGGEKLLMVSFVSAIVSAALFLKQRPLPEDTNPELFSRQNLNLNKQTT